MKRFISEEVGTWSTLRSPRVAGLFGVVREGPYVLLFMDLKAGKIPSSLPLSQRGFDSDIINGMYNACIVEKDGDKEDVIINTRLCGSMMIQMTVKCPCGFFEWQLSR